MTQFLPPNLLALFAPRDPVPYLPPVDKLTHEKKRQPYTGVADYLDYFEDPEETPPPVRIETKAERLERKRREKAEQAAYKLEQDLALWDANNNPDATTNPYKTLFVARINYDTSESKLRREFEAYGKIKQIKIVHDVNTGKPRGYAFIEYEEESDMHAAYKRADGKKIDGRRVTVDIERGRTIEGWKPRRLGGGKGGTRRMPITQDTPIEDVADIKINNNRDRERDRDRDRERDRERKRSRDKRSRSRSPVKRRRSRSKDRHRSKSRDRLKKSRRSRSRDRVERPNQKRVRSRSRDNRMNRNNDEYSNRNNGTNESSMGYNNNNDDGDYENY